MRQIGTMLKFMSDYLKSAYLKLDYLKLEN